VCSRCDIYFSVSHRRHSSIASKPEKQNCFMLVSSSLVRKYRVIEFYPLRFLGKIFGVYLAKNKRLHSEERSLSIGGGEN
jgi:hypothetical protein